MAKRRTTRADMYALFDSGCERDSPEVTSTGLAKNSIDRYYFDWKKARATPPESEPEPEVVIPEPEDDGLVAVRDLPVGGKFTITTEGETQVYCRVQARAGAVVAEAVQQLPGQATWTKAGGAVTLPYETRVAPFIEGVVPVPEPEPAPELVDESDPDIVTVGLIPLGGKFTITSVKAGVEITETFMRVEGPPIVAQRITQLPGQATWIKQGGSMSLSPAAQVKLYKPAYT